MKQYQVAILIVTLFVAAAALPAFAIAKASSDALDAFRRYEPDFSLSVKRLQEMARKVENQGLQPKTDEFDQILDDAEEVMDFVQRRYDLLEDLFKGVSGDNPDDRAQLFDGFQRIEDLYREARDFYNDNFSDGGLGLQSKKKPAAPAPKTSPASDVEKQGSLPAAEKSSLATPTTSAATPAPAVEPVPVMPIPTTVPALPSAARAAETKERKLRWHGSLRIDWRNRNEEYTAQNTALPNNLGQGKLALIYDINDRSKFILEEKYLQRKRNEPVKENQLVLSYFTKPNKENAYTLKHTLQHVWYPDADRKDYRNNLSEVYWNWHQGKWDRLSVLGYEWRKYPRYDRADFRQLNFDDQTTYFVPNGTLFLETKYNWRSYDNSANLDYMNYNYYAEFNRSYTGNKSDISISNTYDRRNFGDEAINLFRANYWDNYFRFQYDLPVSEKWTLVFEDEWQKRNYASDDPRGYGQLKLKTTAKTQIDKNTRGRLSHTYIYNDENTRAKGHLNHIFSGTWERKFNDRFKVKVEDTYQRRYGMVGNTLSFQENEVFLRATYVLPSKISLNWDTRYLNRIYEALFFRDYRWWSTGLTASFAKSRQYDWQVAQSYRKVDFRNGNNVNTPWQGQTQPISEGKFNVFLRDDLKLKLLASREKTYYRTFDTLAQELLWDFDRPLTITEFYLGLEYDF